MLVAVGALVTALFWGTLVEYVIHRLMHAGWFLGRRHTDHHREGWGQGVVREFIDYSAGLPVIFLLGYLRSVEMGIGFASGSIVYALLAAYSHQIQHERPELVFWLRQPVHYLHHKHDMRRHNFGILVDFWDRIFGTYKIVEWSPERRPDNHHLRAFFQIKWY